jgi:N-methylhydantoinase A
MRYLGQVHECTVSIPASAIDAPMVAEIAELFHQRHESLYTYAERETGVPELINLAVTVLGKVPAIRIPEAPAGGPDATHAHVAERPAFFVEHGRYIDTPVFDGSLVQPGNVFAGPAIVEEPTTTIVVFPGSTMTFDGQGFYAMSAVAESATADVTSTAQVRGG